MLTKQLKRSERSKKSDGEAGPLGLIYKLGAKLLGWAPKLIKIVKFGKVGLAAASVAAYSLLWTWQFALVLMVMLMLHEYGHLWMMKRFGMKTKGMYFIPLVGAAAVAEEDFPSRRAEAIIAIAGPVVGLLCAGVVGVVYLITGTPFFAAVASWTALINLFNLLPVTPLDEGRILKSITLSIGTRIGLTAMILGLMLGVVFALEENLVLFVILIPLGLIDFLFERRKANKVKKTKQELSTDFGIEFVEPRPLQPLMTKAGVTRAFIAYVCLASALWVIMSLMASEPGANVAMKVLQG